MPRIGHASISERGTVNGIKGDQTGREVYVREWYNYPWDFMAVHPNAQVREKHARCVEQACANDKIGYGQADRNTLYPLAKAAGFDLSKVGACNCDCSSLQNVAACASGSGATYGANGWCTFNMEENLRKLGYIIITDKKFLTSADYCVRGAIYVNRTHHTAAGLDNGSKASEALKAAGAAGSSSAGSASASVKYNSTTKPAAAPAETPKVEVAREPKDEEMAGVYTTTAELNLRTGAGTDKEIIAVMPKGARVNCYGYYNLAGAVRWPCVMYTAGGKTYTGYCSSEYLEK